MMIPPQIKQMMQMLRSASDPQAMLNQLIQTNPNVREVMNIVKQHGNDPKRAFYALAEQKGINPQSVLEQLK